MKEIVTQVIVPREHPSLPGHFPGNPIVPGVVLLDLVFAAIRDEVGAGTTLHSIVSTKFLRAVAPDARVDLQIKFINDDSAHWKARFSAAHANETVLEGSFLIGVEHVA